MIPEPVHCPCCTEPIPTDSPEAPYCGQACRHEDAWIDLPNRWIRRAIDAYEEAADFTDGHRLGNEAEEHGNYVIGFHASTLEAFENDISEFIRYNAFDLTGLNPDHVGHDFWLTRNHHGAGFWDGDYPQELGDRLTKAAHCYGECNLYVGDDGWVYAG